MTTSANLELKRLCRYGIIGIGSNATLYLLFLGMIWADLGPVVSSAICYVLGVIFSYVLNRRWTFTSSNRHSQDLPRFLVAYMIGFGTTLFLMYILVATLGPELAQLITIGGAAGAIYVSLRLLNFGASE